MEVTEVISEAIAEYIDKHFFTIDVASCEIKLNALHNIFYDCRGWFRDTFENELHDNDSDIYNAIWTYGWINIDWFNITNTIQEIIRETQRSLEDYQEEENVEE